MISVLLDRNNFIKNLY